MIIAVDGPAGAGKSTISREIAKKTGITYIDTGAMYRAFTLKVLREDIDIGDIEKIREVLLQTRVDFDEGKIYLDGEYVEDEIRGETVTRNVSAVSSIEAVRNVLVEKQREIAKRRSSILDGRDIGTVVFPDADLKIFLVADVEVRARRRMKENIEKGMDCDFEEMKAEIIRRDLADSTREISPLKKAEDAVEIDTGNKTIEELSDEIIRIIEERK
ncbi:MAG: (d)CMP kinase [Peptostreptococcaceae bacterium]|nr:(d)CMP kinase [Peptostreptococcaceae bacterium]